MFAGLTFMEKKANMKITKIKLRIELFHDPEILSLGTDSKSIETLSQEDIFSSMFNCSTVYHSQDLKSVHRDKWLNKETVVRIYHKNYSKNEKRKHENPVVWCNLNGTGEFYVWFS